MRGWTVRAHAPFSDHPHLPSMRRQRKQGAHTTPALRKEKHLLSSPPPAALLFPLWNDPVCGDGVCSFPVEYPAFGRFGCIADCGLSTLPTSTVTVTVTAGYRQNSVVTQSMQEAFVAATRWNLCFWSNYTNVPTQLCWFEKARAFASATETQTLVLNLPDADWSVRSVPVVVSSHWNETHEPGAGQFPRAER